MACVLKYSSTCQDLCGFPRGENAVATISTLLQKSTNSLLEKYGWLSICRDQVVIAIKYNTIQYNLVICIAPSEPKKVIIGRFIYIYTEYVFI